MKNRFRRGGKLAKRGKPGLARYVSSQERKRVEEMRKENECILRDFVQAVSDVSFIIDEEGRCIDFFGDPAAIFPLAVASPRGLTIFDTMPGEQAEELMAEIKRALAQRGSRCLDYTLDLAKGRRDIRRRVAPMSYTVNGKKTAAVAFQDITDQERTRRSLQIAYEMRQRSKLINELMHSVRPLDEQALAYCHTLGLDLSRPLLACVIAFQDGMKPDKVERERQMIDKIVAGLDEIAGCTAWTYQGKVGVFCQIPEYVEAGKIGSLRLAVNIRGELRKICVDLAVIIGVSRVYQGAEGLRKSTHEAWKSMLAIECGLTSSDGNFHYDDLGILQLLMEVSGREKADEFVQEMIGKLIEYDEEKGTDYLATLEVMLQTTSLKEAAQALFLHYNTAVYRKGRIEKLLGMPINGFETRMALYAAIKLYRLQSIKQKMLSAHTVI